MATVTIVLRKDKMNIMQKAPLHFRITKNRKSSYISSGEFIEEKHWDSKKNKAKPSCPNSDRLNAYLIHKIQEVHDQVLQTETTQKLPSGKSIKRAIMAKLP